MNKRGWLALAIILLPTLLGPEEFKFDPLSRVQSRGRGVGPGPGAAADGTSGSGGSGGERQPGQTPGCPTFETVSAVEPGNIETGGNGRAPTVRGNLNAEAKRGAPPRAGIERDSLYGENRPQAKRESESRTELNLAAHRGSSARAVTERGENTPPPAIYVPPSAPPPQREPASAAETPPTPPAPAPQAPPSALLPPVTAPQAPDTFAPSAAQPPAKM